MNNNTLNQFIGFIMDLEIKPEQTSLKHEKDKLSLLKDEETYSIEAVDEYIDKLERAIDALKIIKAEKIKKLTASD